MSSDPTKTKTLRRDFESDAFKRFRSLKGELRQLLETEDVFWLGTTNEQASAQKLDGGTVALLERPSADGFKFLSNPEKKEQFQQWLRTQIDEDILGTTDRGAVREGRAWHGQYVRTAYGKGVQHADNELRKQGFDVPEEDIADVFNKPIHREKLSMLYLRAFDNLEGITQAMDTQISRELTNAMGQGWNPRKAASEINDRVDKVGITRARTLARTEIINAHAESTLTRLEGRGIENVTARVEFSTAGDSRVCSICKSLSGNTYTIDEARGRIPAHPRCRCAWLPTVTSD